jgi:hypothetical protein
MNIARSKPLCFDYIKVQMYFMKNYFLIFSIMLLYMACNGYLLTNMPHKKRETISTRIYVIDSIFDTKIYSINKKIVAIEYRASGQVIKVGLIDTTKVLSYIETHGNVAIDLFISNCVPCHYSYPDFYENIKSKTSINKFELRAALCTPAHDSLDGLSCKLLNNFEVELIVNYINFGKSMIINK